MSWQACRRGATAPPLVAAAFGALADFASAAGLSVSAAGGALVCARAAAEYKTAANANIILMSLALVLWEWTGCGADLANRASFANPAGRPYDLARGRLATTSIRAAATKATATKPTPCKYSRS